jgi:hypothetical protein
MAAITNAMPKKNRVKPGIGTLVERIIWGQYSFGLELVVTGIWNPGSSLRKRRQQTYVDVSSIVPTLPPELDVLYPKQMTANSQFVRVS